MKVKFKLQGKPVEVNFSVHPNTKSGFSVIASTSKDSDVVQSIISDSEPMVIQKGLLKHLESKLKLPIQIDHNYPGTGFGFKLDLYSLLQKL